MSSPSLGLVVNPVAGMGGRVGLHGTDAATLGEARARGAVPVAPLRAAKAIQRLHGLSPSLHVVTAAGSMGADLVRDTGWPVDVLSSPAADGETDAGDTRTAVTQLVAAGVRLVLFVGGDGTARDVASCVGDVPVVGVPAGVKMHSGVFGTTPDAAALAASRYLADPDRCPTRPAEVVDRDEAGVVRLYGSVEVPVVASALQQGKGASAAGSDDASALGHEVAAGMETGRLYVLGPGTTVAAVSGALGLPATPLGVDVVLDGRLLASDVGEAELLTLLSSYARATLVLGVVGGQGFLLGRGNQQLSPAVLSAIGTDNLEILATPAKVAGLVDPVLHVDLDDLDLADRLVGYRRVRTGRTRSTVLRVVA